jgi:glycerophosphoryl diester phosphodiesterase
MNRVSAFSPSGCVLNIAHGGALDPSRANSLEGICDAIASGIDAIEVDVQVTQDGIPVLFHDSSLPLNGGLIRISDRTLSELTAMDVEAHGRCFTLLSDVLDKVRDTKTWVVLDIKARPALDAVIRAIRDARAEALCFIASFDYATLVRSKYLYLELPTILTLGPSRVMASPLGFLWTMLALLFPLVAAARIHADVILCPAYRLTRRLVSECRKKGIAVFVWDVRNISQSYSLLDYDVHGIVTDWPLAIRDECRMRETEPRGK